MNLHTPQDNPDWEQAASGGAAIWQQLALVTRGIITPGNILSILGLAAVVWGAWQLSGSHWEFGLCLIAIGRLADLADGYVAELTKTKSRLGEAVDATCDKLAVGTIAIATFASQYAPHWFLVYFAAYNLHMVLFGLVWGRQFRLHPSRSAKLAMFTSWIAILCLIAYAKLPTTPILMAGMLTVIVYGWLSVVAIVTYYHDLSQAKQKRAEATRWAHEVTGLLCVSNTKATHYAQAYKLLLALGETLGLKPTKIDVNGHEQALKQFFRHRKQEQPVIIAIAGGDGTVSAVVNTLLRLQPQEMLTQCYVLPLWGGNANDLAYMLNGLRMAASPRRLVSRSGVVQVPLIKVKIREPGRDERTMYACCYASFGASAYAARQLEAHRFSTNAIMRWLPPVLLLREITYTVKSFLSAPLHKGEIDSKEQTFYEHTMINGSRIAKVDRVPIGLDEPAFFHALITRKDPSIALAIIRIMLRKPGREYGTRTHLQFTTRTSVDAQIDGEIMRLPAHTRVTATTTRPPFRFISMKLSVKDLANTST